MAEIDLSALPDDIAKQVNETIEALEAEVTELRATIATAEVEDLTGEDDVLKGAPDEVRELVAKMQNDLNSEVAKRRDAEFAKRVSDDNLEVLLGDADEVGPVLREIADAAPDAFDKVYSNLLAAAQRADLAKTLSEFGSDAAETDPFAKRDAYIAKQRDAGDDRTDAQLAAEFWKQNPDERKASREAI